MPVKKVQLFPHLLGSHFSLVQKTLCWESGDNKRVPVIYLKKKRDSLWLPGISRSLADILDKMSVFWIKLDFQ